jgi:hypothetical protein
MALSSSVRFRFRSAARTLAIVSARFSILLGSSPALVNSEESSVKVRRPAVRGSLALFFMAFFVA